MDSLHRTRSNRPLQRGHTLIETTATGTILALLLCSAIPSFSGLIERHRLTGLATQVATDLQFIRSTSIWRNEPLRLSFYNVSAGSCYVVHSGTRPQCTCSVASGTAACTGGAVPLKTMALPASTGLTVQANVTSMLFDPLHGTSTPSGTLRVTSTAGSIHHIVNVLGRVRTCTPDLAPALPGFRTC